MMESQHLVTALHIRRVKLEYSRGPGFRRVRRLAARLRTGRD
jgi:hypothetical protein